MYLHNATKTKAKTNNNLMLHHFYQHTPDPEQNAFQNFLKEKNAFFPSVEDQFEPVSYQNTLVDWSFFLLYFIFQK